MHRPTLDRVTFFRTLVNLKLPPGAVVLCGGDFNCVTDRQVDRIGGGKSEEAGVKVLMGFIEQNDLMDTGFCNLPTKVSRNDIVEYANLHHTHRHKSARGVIGSSRLDRWYISVNSKKLIRGQTTEESPWGPITGKYF